VKICCALGINIFFIPQFSTKKIRLSKLQKHKLLENRRTSLLNEDLSNEPNFGRIHLAGQYGKVRQAKQKMTSGDSGFNQSHKDKQQCTEK
jgi:hypothetical protein